MIRGAIVFAYLAMVACIAIGLSLDGVVWRVLAVISAGIAGLLLPAAMNDWERWP